jgi:hypothetical protein
MNGSKLKDYELYVSHLPPEQRKFYEQHGDYVIDDGQVFFVDGAVEESGFRGRFQRRPPQDEYQRLLAVQNYWKVKAEKSLEDFEYLKNILQNHPALDRVRQKEQVSRLEALRDDARMARKKLRETEKSIAKTQAGNIENAGKQNNGWTTQRQQQFRSEIANIQI